MPHHVTPRGNRRAQIYFSDDDSLTYLTRLQADAAQRGLGILAYCLMPNHMPVIGVPVSETALRQRTHTGRPLGSPEFLTHLETILGRAVTPGKRGPKAKGTAVEEDNGSIM